MPECYVLRHLVREIYRSDPFPAADPASLATDGAMRETMPA
jgi:hypothetical protein